MTNEKTVVEVSEQELTLIETARRNRPQGFACEDGIVRCRICVRKIMQSGDLDAIASISPVERYTPLLGDGDDWCSECDVDIQAREV